MKNFIKVLFLIFSILAIQEQACLGDEYDFRKTKWGMSKNQVLKTEQSKPVCNDCFSDSSSDSVLGYNSKVLGKSVAVVYFFINNQLVRANYVLMERHTNKNDYIDDFNDFKQAITKKYGEPAAEEETWKNEIFKNDKSKWG
jgi:hypothetical protein